MSDEDVKRIGLVDELGNLVGCETDGKERLCGCGCEEIAVCLIRKRAIEELGFAVPKSGESNPWEGFLCEVTLSRKLPWAKLGEDTIRGQLIASRDRDGIWLEDGTFISRSVIQFIRPVKNIKPHEGG